jgi:hypothetical protein
MLLAKDQDAKKGTVEATLPAEEDLGTPDPLASDPNHPGLDDLGLPNDPIAIAQDVEGANEDESQG